MLLHPVVPNDSEASPTHLIISSVASTCHFERSEKSPLWQLEDPSPNGSGRHGGLAQKHF